MPISQEKGNSQRNAKSKICDCVLHCEKSIRFKSLLRIFISIFILIRILILISPQPNPCPLNVDINMNIDIHTIIHITVGDNSVHIVAGPMPRPMCGGRGGAYRDLQRAKHMGVPGPWHGHGHRQMPIGTHGLRHTFSGRRWAIGNRY